jgi:hypothetical protein
VPESTPAKVGAPRGNMNGLVSGSNVRRLTVGELPSSMVAVKREGRAYRRELEAAVMAVKGEVGILDSHLIDTATAATIQAGVCRWLLRNKLEEKAKDGSITRMSTADIRGCQADIVKAKERRDNAVKALQLDKKEDIWASLRQSPQVTDVEE